MIHRPTFTQGNYKPLVHYTVDTWNRNCANFQVLIIFQYPYFFARRSSMVVLEKNVWSLGSKKNPFKREKLHQIQLFIQRITPPVKAFHVYDLPTPLKPFQSYSWKVFQSHLFAGANSILPLCILLNASLVALEKVKRLSNIV